MINMKFIIYIFSLLMIFINHINAKGISLTPKNLFGRTDVIASESTTANHNNKGVQVMITQKMRKVLVQELGYLESEVDILEPQIAAVLIERNLPRPAKGMPDSWCIKPVDAGKSSDATSQVISAGDNVIKQKMSNDNNKRNVLHRLVSTVSSHPVIPVSLTIAGLCIWQYPAIASATKYIITSTASAIISTSKKVLNKKHNNDKITTTKTVTNNNNKEVSNIITKIATESSIDTEISTPPPPLPPKSVFPFNKNHVSSVDVLALEKVFHHSPHDSVNLRFDLFQNKFL